MRLVLSPQEYQEIIATLPSGVPEDVNAELKKVDWSVMMLTFYSKKDAIRFFEIANKGIIQDFNTRGISPVCKVIPDLGVVKRRKGLLLRKFDVYLALSEQNQLLAIFLRP